MSEEELIEIIKENLSDMKSSIEMNKCFEINSEQAKEFYFAIATVLTLKEKQQKEIEELKEKNNQLSDYLNDSYYVSADKIREMFQFYIERDSLFNDDTHKMAVIRLKDVLKELLEENNEESNPL